MKRFFRRSVAILLSAALLITPVLASYALGDEIYDYTIPLAENATLTTQVLYSNSGADLRTENYITYRPGSNLSPMVAYGSTVLSKKTLSGLASDLESSGRRVLSGVNGDYFVVATGAPLGILITNGILRSSAGGFEGVGFLSDGSAIMSNPDLSITASFLGYTLDIAGVNKVRTDAGGYYLLTQDFGSTTQNTQAGVDVVLSPVTDNLGQTTVLENGRTVTYSDNVRIGGRVSCVVEEVLESTGSVAIPEGKFVITINSKSNEWLIEMLRQLSPGDTMELDVTSSDTRWNNVDCAIGSYGRLLYNGTVAGGLEAGANPRTAIGLKPNGEIVFYTIDGRKSGHSIGASLTQVATRLSELGCTEAVYLDGGGSTTLGSTAPDSNGFSIDNTPSDGSQRAVTNALFLVSNLSASGTPGSIYITPNERVLLSGASTAFTTSFVDTNWFPVSYSDSITWSASIGSFSGSTYIAPAAGGTDVITATASGGISGSTTVTVLSTVDKISVTNEDTGAAVTSLQVPEEHTVNLRANASFRGVPVSSQDTNYTWTVTPANLGTITGDGTFTSSKSGGSGTISVTGGGMTVSIPLTVAAQSVFYLLEDFEGSHLFESSSATLTSNTIADQVRYGTRSLRVDYTLQSGSSTLSTTLNATQGDYLGVWVYGDNSGNQFTATVLDTTGSVHTTNFGTLNFTGWKQMWAALPSDPAAVTGFTISGEAASGTIWLDQIVTSNQTLSSTTGPTVSVSVSGNQLSGNIYDLSGTLSGSQVKVTLDGSEVTNFEFNSTTGALSATLPDLGTAMHRVTVSATGTGGSIGRASQTINSDSVTASQFVDMADHWALTYVEYLSGRGIITGVSTSSGMQFNPGQSITRGDFALMTARWMGLDLDSYSGITLPFQDTSSIPSWSLNAVKAMYALGIMKGSETSSGLYANAGSSITRAEAMTILGRIQPKGYPQADLSTFSDASAVPQWASGYIASLVQQEVVSGNNGRLNPNDPVSRAEVAKMLFTMW